MPAIATIADLIKELQRHDPAARPLIGPIACCGVNFGAKVRGAFRARQMVGGTSGEFVSYRLAKRGQKVVIIDPTSDA